MQTSLFLMNIKPKNTHRYFMSLQVYCRGCSKNPGLDVLSRCTTKMRYRMGYIYGPQSAFLSLWCLRKWDAKLTYQSGMFLSKCELQPMIYSMIELTRWRMMHRGYPLHLKDKKTLLTTNHSVKNSTTGNKDLSMFM